MDTIGTRPSKDHQVTGRRFTPGFFLSIGKHQLDFAALTYHGMQKKTRFNNRVFTCNLNWKGASVAFRHV